MLEMPRKLFALLNRRERVQLALLLIAVIVMAFVEVVSIAAVLPFLSVATDPSIVRTNPLLAWTYAAFAFTDTTHFLIALGCVALFSLLLSNVCIAATIWAQARFSFERVHAIGRRLLRHYAAQPYVFFLSRNSADLTKNVMDEIEEVAQQVIMSGLQLVARSVLAIAIIGLLVVFDPLIALLLTAVLSGAYTGIYMTVRRWLTRLGYERVIANAARYKAASELFGGMKDLKLLGRETALIHAFEGPSATLARNQATASIIAQLPRYALEVLAFGGMLLIAVSLLFRGEGYQQMLPVLGLYAFAGYRLMPCLQEVFRALTQLRFGAAAVDNLYRELSQPTAPPTHVRRTSSSFPLRNRLELARVTFVYPGTQKPVLEDLSLTVHAGTAVGIMGTTGSGKTTLVDVILGLLRPQRGEIRIDDHLLDDRNLRSWQNGIGYVPQQIYLADETIASNIAFAVPRRCINMEAVERAARLADIHSFVTKALPYAYQTLVGERGVRLSGGQRQRIGIARALYHDPGLLVLDEATNALDSGTEDAVLDAITSLRGTRTIILVAHRQTTLRSCNAIFNLEGGILRNWVPSAAQISVDGPSMRQSFRCPQCSA